METIRYIKHDVTDPQGEGRKFVIHCCNDEGKWGAGVVLAISKKWSKPESQYRLWSKEEDFKLGNIQAVRVEKDVAVINMIGQKGIYSSDGIPPVRYDAVKECLTKVADLAEKYNASVHLPYLMCCDLAGGDWNKIECMLLDLIWARTIPITIYDLFGKRK